MRVPRIAFDRRALVLATPVLPWLALTGLLVVSRGDPEAFLIRNVGRSCRDDAFHHLNAGLPSFWFVHLSLVLAAIAAARSRRTDVLTVLLIGPALALALNLCCEAWSDPNWYVIAAVDTVGRLASTLVGCVYWGQRPTASP